VKETLSYTFEIFSPYAIASFPSVGDIQGPDEDNSLARRSSGAM
jgi:hypothetical protein